MIPSDFPYKKSGHVEMLDKFASASVLNGATGNALTFTVEARCHHAYLTAIGLGIDSPTAFATSVFRVKVNGSPDRNYQSIQDELAAFNDPRPIAPIKLKPNDIVTIECTNSSGATRLYAGRLKGFLDYESDQR